VAGGHDTPVASEQSEDAVRDAISAAAALAAQQGQPQERAPPTATVVGASQASGQATAAAAATLGPTGAAPDGSQDSRSALRERSPRREADAAVPAPARAAEAEKETPQLPQYAVDAALRGDSIGSLPDLEVETPQLTASNQRGGALPT
jgi:hypothetical protein